MRPRLAPTSTVEWMDRRMLSVLAFLPNAGLGNKLFVWARAQTFASLNGLKCYSYGWTQPRIGPLLRGERRDIRYGAGLKWDIYGQLAGLLSQVSSRRWDYDPQIREIDITSSERCSFIFKRVPHWSDYFIDIRDRRDDLMRLLSCALKSSVVEKVDAATAPIVAVHLRKGDFRDLRPGEDFARVGLVRTPEDYFIELIDNVRSCAGTKLPVTIFSDGSDEECRFLTRIEGIHRAPKLSDLADMIIMSKARVIIPSAGSTFGLWSSFLSSAAVIVHPDHYHAPIRPPAINSTKFEGPAVGHWKDWDGLLIGNIKAVAKVA